MAFSEPLKTSPASASRVRRSSGSAPEGLSLIAQPHRNPLSIGNGADAAPHGLCFLPVFFTLVVPAELKFSLV
jgi:hypothetical protein